MASVRLLECMGAPATRIIDDVDLPRAALCDSELLIPLHLCGQFLARVARSEGMDDFGFRFGEMPLEGLGGFGVLLAQSRTLREACESATRTRELFNSGARIWLSCEGERVWIRQAIDPRVEHGRRELEQFWAAQVLRLVRAAMGAARIPLELHLRAPETRAARDHALLSDVDVRFARAGTGVAFPRELLGWPLPGNPSRGIVEFERRLAASRPAADFVASVRQVVGSLLSQGYPDVRRVANAVGLSSRTLQRRLTERGQSYSKLVDGERLSRALALLRDARVTITEIALALGYCDLATFTHAFRRWTGVSPREFKRRVAVLTPRAHAEVAGAGASRRAASCAPRSSAPPPPGRP
jgi:AraC-like DNA-binding protein